MHVLLMDLPVTLIQKVRGRLRGLYRRDVKRISARIDRRFPVGDLD